MIGSLSDKSVLVVGGSSGIGLATAQAARQAGARVTIAARSPERLALAAQALGEAQTLCMDVSDEAAVADALGAAGCYDHVVVTSGSVPPTPLKGAASGKARGGFDSKFWGAWHVAAHADIAPDGSVTLVSGVFALRPQKGLVAASCVNAAVDALARALALELAPVRVNAVSPGLIDTPMWSGMKSDRRAAFFEQSTHGLPGGYLGKPDDVAALILACIVNPLVTGSVLVADAGRVLV